GNDHDRSTGLPWVVHQSKQYGKTAETSRDFGSVQKDWAVVEANQLPEVFAIAVRAHNGWNHKDNRGVAKYCLVVSFESLGADLPIYTAIQENISVESELPSEALVDIEFGG
ncbi:MAG: protease, partial [Verrucomicrobiota bacterium]